MYGVHLIIDRFLREYFLLLVREFLASGFCFPGDSVIWVFDGFSDYGGFQSDSLMFLQKGGLFDGLIFWVFGVFEEFRGLGAETVAVIEERIGVGVVWVLLVF